MLQMVMLATELVELCISIFGITHKRMSDGSKVCTYLMSPACFEYSFYEGKPAESLKHPVGRICFLGIAVCNSLSESV